MNLLDAYQKTRKTSRDICLPLITEDYIPQLAIAQQYRRKGCATTLLKHLIGWSDGDKIKIINTDANYYPFKKFADSINLAPGIGQYEMMLKL